MWSHTYLYHEQQWALHQCAKQLKEKEPSITCYWSWVVPIPCKGSQLASTARMFGSDKRGGKRVYQNLQLKIFFTEDGGNGRRGYIKTGNQLPRSNCVCPWIKISLFPWIFLEFTFFFFFKFSPLQNLWTFWSKTTGNQPSLMEFSFWKGYYLQLLCAHQAIWYIRGLETNSLGALFTISWWKMIIIWKNKHKNMDITACRLPQEATSHFL